MKGYAGRVLRVDLSTGRLATEPLDEDRARRFIGGRGLAASYLAAELGAGADPLGSENLLVLATGPFQGAPLPGHDRWTACARSPLTGGWGDANASGPFGTALKGAGFDAVLVQGLADRPVYLWLDGGRAELRDAAHLWGRTVADATDALLAELPDGAQVACIGPAGERKVRFASIVSSYNRVAARSGLGAVMGAKGLKAVCARPARPVPVADRRALAAASREFVRAMADSPNLQLFKLYGTPGAIRAYNALGMLPVKNFLQGTAPEAEAVSGEALARTFRLTAETCAGCPVWCRRRLETSDPVYGPVDPRYGGPDFETVGSLGAACGIFDPHFLARANALANAYGLDTVNLGLALAWAMECTARGILTPADTDGLRLQWGDARAALAMVERIARRQGFGALLAEGVGRAAREVGRGSEALAMHVKNQALPAHDPRSKVGLGLTFATANRGACHLQGVHDTSLEAGILAPELGLDPARYRGLSRTAREHKAAAQVAAQDWKDATDCLIMCKFLAYDYGPGSPGLAARLLSAVTGWDVGWRELLLAGARCYTLGRLVNLRCGLGRADDLLPARVADGLDGMLEEYYALRGWDASGVPRPETLARLGLDDYGSGSGR